MARGKVAEISIPQPIVFEKNLDRFGNFILDLFTFLPSCTVMTLQR
ncbi:hypothetical protein LEP1GSC195_2098 [Leptospira wolbachii serovar Codice str. CDC]|uniref:Uncharacterized protein n=1 Tax=Leptospira wolbachii serovar Codice str. CDC TaxID=1218599 RepID=R8ZZX8_9LEPT|nr:hypothetical protein LEP1GSC195_2098 [Leptospira wolbachii serovar Codice str. CDC]